MSTFGRTQPRISAEDADQPFQVAGSSHAGEAAAKANTTHIIQNTNSSDKAV